MKSIYRTILAAAGSFLAAQFGGWDAALETQTEVKRRDHKMVEKVTELDETIKSMKEEYGRKVSVDEVADRLGISEDEIEDILKLAGEEVKDEE